MNNSLYTIDDLLVDNPVLLALAEPVPSFIDAGGDGVSPSAIGSGGIEGNLTVQDGYLQSSNYVASTTGWRLTPTSGDFNFAIQADEVHVPDEDTTANSAHIDTDGNTWWGATTTNFVADNENALAYILKDGTAKFQSLVLKTNVEISGIKNSTLTDISLLEMSHDLVFSSSDADTAAWASGTITLSNGRTFSIDAGNTGNMAALTYIYLDPGVSSTVLQTSTTYSDATGANKKVIAVAQNTATGNASVIPYGSGTPVINGTDQIAALSIVAGNIAASTVTADKMNVSQLSAINANIGTITAGNMTIDSSGYIRGGATGYLVGTGFWMGYSGAAYKFHIGNPSGNYLSWDGTDLLINGYAAATVGTFGGDGSDGALSISSGTTTLDAGGAKVLVKNYSSISITGTAKITLSNTHANGTILVLKSLNNTTITSSGTSIDLVGMGGSGGSGAALGTTSAGLDGDDGSIGASFVKDEVATIAGGGGGLGDAGSFGGAAGDAGEILSESYTTETYKLLSRMIQIACGNGGGGGGSSAAGTGGGTGVGGDGGNGGGAILLECGGAYSFSGEIDTSGAVGSDGGDASAVDDSAGGGAGGGGSAGMICVLYKSLTSDTGTYTAAGGNGGVGGDATGEYDNGGGAAGGGGGGAGAYAGAGGAGGAGYYESGVGGGNGGNGSAGSDGAGGGGGGGAGYYEVTYGTNTGGTAGSGGSSDTDLIISTLNKYFG